MARLEREKHYANTRQILACSNATPIWSHSDGGYVCCYCTDRFPDPADLKQHTLQTHNNEDIANFQTRTNLNSYFVKLDITGLCCTLCSEEIDTVELLIHHLKRFHQRPIYTDINSRLMPFKFLGTHGQLRCFICTMVFSKFKALLEHMNVHYRNFICEICDAGFITRTMAVTHTNIHKTGTFKCRFCPRVYDTKSKMNTHERAAHSLGETLNKCGLCDERFKYYYHKEKHLYEVHGVANEAKCQACDRIFENQKKLRVHVRKHHLMEKKHRCTICDKDFFSNSELRDHSVKHTGLKEYQCDLCPKSYGRKKSLKVHMRVHGGGQIDDD